MKWELFLVPPPSPQTYLHFLPFCSIEEAQIFQTASLLTFSQDLHYWVSPLVATTLLSAL